MAKNRKSKKTKSVTVRKYPFDPDSKEIYKLTPDEIERLEHGSSGKAKAWNNPSQLDYDLLRERLVAFGYREDSLKHYSVPDIVRALQRGFEKSLKYEFEVVGAQVREIWRDRYLQVTTDSKHLEYWHNREKNILNRLVKANDEHLAKNKNVSEEARAWLSEIWIFGRRGRPYRLPDDLDAIYLAVGLRLDTLFNARNLVTDEMLKVIINEWQFDGGLRLSKENVSFCFAPHFRGEIMAYGDPLELFWGHIKADLQDHGFDSPDSENSETKMSLREFLEKRTDVDLVAIDSKIKRIKAVDKNKSILPKTANTPQGNQTKLFYEMQLEACWSALKNEIPTLPNLKIIK